jgi:hypothetical protein
VRDGKQQCYEWRNMRSKRKNKYWITFIKLEFHRATPLERNNIDIVENDNGKQGKREQQAK